ncbi:MAG: serine/threonine-protein kinase, partial [Acidobacteriota bacterium]
VALSNGPVLSGSVTVGENPGALLAGLPVQMLESLMREAAPGGIYFTKQVYQEVGQVLQQAQIEVKGQRGILTPQPLYFVDADAAARATGAKALTETTSQVSGEARSLADLRPGMMLAGRFDLLAEIGGGRLGVVWKAQDRDLGDLVTLKMLRAEAVQDAVQFDRLKRSVARARSIRHPNVLSVLDFGEADRMPYIEGEYARGMTLAYVLEQARQVPVVAGVRMARQIAWALSAAHGQQLMHGGLKPENVLVETAGGAVRVMDFGLHAPVRPGAEVPSPAYLAPEQLEGREPDSRADFFSYGVLVYHLLTGKLPYPGASVGEVRQRIATEQPAPPTSVVAEIPQALEALILKCLAPNPDQRFSSITELVDALDAIKV